MDDKILLTGADGFLGKIISSQLQRHNVLTLGRKRGSNIVVDLCDHVNTLPYSDLIIHAAGKAHSIPKTEAQSQEFFNVNVTGTLNLLKALEASGIPKAFVFISSVAVYGRESGNQLSENEPLLALDAYGKSKIDAEKVVSNWCAKNNVICTMLRLPLIAGPNPPGNLRSMIKGIKRGYYFNIAGGKAKKSMVLAEDVAKIIPIAANVGGIYNLTDGYHPSLSELSDIIAKQLDKSRPLNISVWVAKILAKTGDVIGPKAPINSKKLRKIMSDLTFDDSKARKLVGWRPTCILDGFKIV